MEMFTMCPNKDGPSSRDGKPPCQDYLTLLDRHSHASIFLGHWNEHVMVVSQVFIRRIRKVHVW